MIWVKRLMLIVMLLVVLLVIAAGVFLATVNPNDYKQQIASLVQEKTGRVVSFDGPIRLSVFPWIGVRLESVAVGNAPGFMPANMLQAKVVEAKAAFWPLLRGQFVIGKLVLDGAEIHLARHRDGVTNWADLLPAAHGTPPSGQSTPTPAPSASPSALALTVGGVEIHHAVLDWQDEVSGQTVHVSALNAEVGALAPGVETPVSVQADYQLSAPNLGSLGGTVQLSANMALTSARVIQANQVVFSAALKTVAGAYPAAFPRTATVAWQTPSVTVDWQKAQISVPQFVLDASWDRGFGLTRVSGKLSGDVQAQWGDGRYVSNTLNLSAAIQGLATHTGEIRFEAHGGASVDLPAGTAQLAHWEIHSAPVALSTSLAITGLGEKLSVTGPLTIAPFNPRDLAAAWKYRLPPMASEKALTECALTGQIKVTPQQAMVNQLNFSLDGQTLTGEVGVSNLAAGTLWARLAGGAWNLTPYFPPKTASAAKPVERSVGAGGSDGGQSARPVVLSQQPIPLPLPLLRGLNLDARVALESLSYQNLSLQHWVLAATAAGGRLHLSQLDFNAFGGAVKSTGALDVRTDRPAYQWATTATNIALQPALSALMNEDRLIGTGDVSASLTAQGSTVGQLESSLGGNGRFALNNGKVKGIDLGYLLRSAQARLQGSTEPVPAQQSTDFSQITGSVQIANGVIRNDDLQGASPLLRVSGKGSVDLPQQALDYLLNVVVVNTATGQGGKALDKLRQLTVPIKITGSFTQPKFGIDMQAVLKDQAKQKLENRVNQELDKRLGNEAAPVKNLLKGLGL